MMEESRKSKTVKSAFDSTTFGADVSIHVERKVCSATISPCGRDVALASPDGLDIIDLDSPLNPPRHLRHGLPWTVADVQWSPFAARDYWVVSTANQKALVWNLNMQEDSPQGAIEHTLKGHTRAITDINFSAHHPDVLATCAVDGYVHCWDLRRPRNPVLTFCDWFGGATQVKYNRQDSHILASSHDRWLRIWDDRKGATPLRSINAHESKIYGVDWNRTRSTGVVTCSLDKSIKFWDYSNNLDEPERIIRTDFPVWRARHTPFGWGLLAMPQDTPGELHLYDRRSDGDHSKDSKAPAVSNFPGHGNQKVKEFLWRPRGAITDDGIDNREFQLVSWGEDGQLRLQYVESKVLEAVGHVKGAQVRKRLNVTRKGAVYKTFRAVDHPSMNEKRATITGPRPGSSGLKISALSAGMKNIISPTKRNHMISRAPAMKPKDRSNKSEDQIQKQIDWMSGIKFSKQEGSSTSHKRSVSRRLSLLHPEFEEDGDWDTPESLHDEIIRIKGQLPKITFEEINMDKRYVIASMNGPWGKDGNAIYINAIIAFPDQYPDKAPTFTLGKTSLMPATTYDKLKREVQQIAAGFVPRKQGCMEAALCYLLGEVDLETSTTFFNDVGDIDDDLDALADESSSDDEDGDIPAGTSAIMSQELDSSATEDMLSTMARNANVPLPRLCGARFAANGKLVCFFPPKEDKVKSLLGTLVAKNNARSTGDSTFETFGRLNSNNSPLPRIKAISVASERDDSDAYDSDESSSSSDSDSQFRVARLPMSEYFRRPNRRSYMKASSTILSQRSSANGTGTGTGTGTGPGSRGRMPKPKNIIALHDISEQLPAKQVLAEEYCIFGDGPDVCEHNSRVAQKHGFGELAEVWKYAAGLLHNEVPLAVLNQTHRREPILVIAKDSLGRPRRDSGSDSGVDFAYDFDHPAHLSGRVKWGTSPLANQLISDLFAHFEAISDLQMLAMLSCVFSEPGIKDAALQAELPLTQPQTPLTMKTPAFSLDYFPTDAAAWSMYDRTPIHSVVSTPKIVQTPSGLYGSMGSSNGAWGSDPASASYSTGETPPLRSNRDSSEHLTQNPQSLSTSPDNPRTFRRTQSGLASSFAASFSRTLSMTKSSSPPNPPTNRKQPSPVENMLSSLAPSTITWGNTTVLGSVKEQTSKPKLSYSDDESTCNDDIQPGWNGISLTMENQNSFDDEGCMSSSLLDHSKSAVYASYRSQYAGLLYLWGHPLARLEILKFNGLKDYFLEIEIPDNRSFAGSIPSTSSHTLNHDSPPNPPIFTNNTYHQQPPTHPDQGLDVTGYCLKHESRLEPLTTGTEGGAVGRCERCKSTQRQLRCVICTEPISALFSTCLSCGCATHQYCLQEYHSFGNTDCPGGCDCDCGDLASIGIVESWEVMMSALERMRMMDAQIITEKEKERLEDWDAGEKEEWDVESTFGGRGGGLGRGYSTLSKKLERVRTGDWGMGSGGKKRASSLRNEETF